MNAQDVPRKTYYSISEVCTMTGLEPHVLRYWESEFPHLRPKKNRAGNRAYRDKDIELIEYIKYLLYDEQYTIPGARKKCGAVRDINTDPEQDAPRPKPGMAQREELLRELREVVRLLRGNENR